MAPLALRPIGMSLALYRPEPREDDWKIRGDGFPVKSVFIDAAGKTVSEEDYHYSEAEFTDSGRHGWERITMHFDCDSKKMILSYTGTNKTTEATSGWPDARSDRCGVSAERRILLLQFLDGGFLPKAATLRNSRRVWTAVAERSDDTAFRLWTELPKRRGTSLPATVQNQWLRREPR